MSEAREEVIDNLKKSVLSFHHAGPGDGTQVIRLVGRCLHLLSHLSRPLSSLLKMTISLLPWHPV